MNIKLRQPLLFIDDDSERYRRMYNLLGNDFDFEWVDTYDWAVRRLQERQWGMIMLDHDLEDPKDRDGQLLANKIVMWQARFGYFDQTSFIVHSSNTEGARRMHGILDRPDLNLVAPVIVPFTLFVF